MTSWSCPHDLNGVCQKVAGAVCDPGMRGCVLEGKVRFANDCKNEPRKPVKAESPAQKKKEENAASRPPAKPCAPAVRRRLPF